MQLANVSDLGEVGLALPVGRRVGAARPGVRRADDRVGVREQDIDIGERVWDGFCQGRLF